MTVKISEMPDVGVKDGSEFGQVVQEGENRKAELLFIDSEGKVPYVDDGVTRLDGDVSRLDIEVIRLSDDVAILEGEIDRIDDRIDDLPTNEFALLQPDNSSATYYTDYMPFSFTTLPSPVVILESDPEEVNVLEFTTEDLPEGVYKVGVSLVADMQSANNQFQWRVDGTFPSPVFLDEAKDDNEVIPQSFEFPINWLGGAITMELWVEVPSGPGNADTTLQIASFTVQRVA